MKIGVVGESAKDKKGNFHFPENAAPLLNQLERDGNQIYLLDHRMKYSSPESFPAINLKLKELDKTIDKKFLINLSLKGLLYVFSI